MVKFELVRLWFSGKMNPSQGLVEGPIPSSRSNSCPFSSTVELWYRKPQMSVQFWQGALRKGKI